MKKILITGANSYIGTSFENWCSQYPENYSIDTVNMRNDLWKAANFAEYDVVFHVAGLAHVSVNPKMEEMYYKINRDLAVETARKAKSDGVKQFIFMSSIIVYGDSSYIDRKRVIDRDTIPAPSNFYGKSKLQAEEGIGSLADGKFKVVILRPPMIYGKGSKGNYPKLSKVALKLPVFPDVDNQRSMLHIDNLSEFIRLMVDNEEHGVFYPQNAEYVKTSEMVKLIAEVCGRKMRLTRSFNPLLFMLGKRISVVNKVFGNLAYAKDMSVYKQNYRIRDLTQSIKVTER